MISTFRWGSMQLATLTVATGGVVWANVEGVAAVTLFEVFMFLAVLFGATLFPSSHLFPPCRFSFVLPFS